MTEYRCFVWGKGTRNETIINTGHKIILHSYFFFHRLFHEEKMIEWTANFDSANCFIKLSR